ncbi:MAG TPA: class I SAM-dependent methyltransferase [Acidimicrobiales bacterium]|nr:class I SAM-dependent methyltransferase [Acidimicrobiales bacterium]
MAVEQDDWDTHWRHYAGSATTNPAEAYRRDLVLRLLDLGAGRPRVLDVGSGQGDLAAAVHERHPEADVAGIELSEHGVAVAAAKVPAADFVRHDLLSGDPLPDRLHGWATHAVCSEVLEHVDEPERLLAAARECMAPGCRLVVTVPGGPRSAFDRHIGHRRHYDRAALRQVLERAGLRVERVSAAGFPFFNLYRLAVILRGEKLIDDVAAEDGGAAASGPALAVMRGFGVLFRANLGATPWGWQIVAVATVPPATPPSAPG